MFWQKKPPEWAKALSMDEYKLFQQLVFEVAEKYGRFKISWEQGAFVSADKPESGAKVFHFMLKELVGTEPEVWREIIETHFEMMYVSMDYESMSREEIMEGLRICLQAESQDFDGAVFTTELIPSLKCLLMYSDKKQMQSIHEDDLAAKGITVPEAFGVAIKNHLKADRELERFVSQSEEIGLTAVAGINCACIILNFEHWRDIDPQRAYFVSMPNRNELLFCSDDGMDDQKVKQMAP